MRPGVYDNISNEEYHASEGLSASGLKLLARSPAHYKYSVREETPAMRKGTAVHTAVFEPERFAASYVIAPDVDKRTKAGKEAWAELEASGKIVLSAKEYETTQAMGDAVRNHRLAGPLVMDGKAEQSVYWRQPVTIGGENREYTEILCKCRPDYVKELGEGYVIVDLKTTSDARPLRWGKSAYWDYGYHIQAAHYMIGMESATGERAREFVFIVAESESPYGVLVYKTPTLTLMRGYEENEELYKVYAGCNKADLWPCYPDMIYEFDLPRGA